MGMLIRKALQEKQITIALFILPAIILVGMFMCYPAIYGFYLSFTNWNGVTPSYKFIGFRNFIEMFQDDIFFLALKNTAIYCVATIIFQHLISLTLAVFLHRGLKGSKLYKSIFFIPSLLSTAVVAVVFSVIFINTVLSMIGSLKAFENVYAMTGGGPINSTEVIATYLYDFGITANRIGYGSAVSLFMFVLIVIISIVQTKLLRSREVEL